MMKELKCELCGSNNLVKQEGVFVCQSCNARYSLEEARKMMFDGEQTVKATESPELTNLYTLARKELDSNNFTAAWDYYRRILLMDPKSWEALFYTTYCKSKTIKLEEFIMFEGIILKTYKKVLISIRDEITDENRQKEIIEDVTNKTIEMTDKFYNASKHYYNIELDPKLRAERKYITEYLNRCGNAELILKLFGNSLISLFGIKYSDFAVKAWKQSIEYRMTRIPNISETPETQKIINEYTAKIKLYDPTYVAPEYQEPEMKFDTTKKKKGLFGRFR